MQSTSLEWIFEYLKKQYGQETNGANFLNISEHTFKKGTPHQTFYKQYRLSFLDNLRKTGDVVKFKNDTVLSEGLSPSYASINFVIFFFILKSLWSILNLACVFQQSRRVGSFPARVPIVISSSTPPELPQEVPGDLHQQLHRVKDKAKLEPLH